MRIRSRITIVCHLYCISSSFTGTYAIRTGIRAAPDVGDSLNTFQGGLNSAILRYTGAPAVEPNTTQTISLLPLNETDLHVSRS